MRNLILCNSLPRSGSTLLQNLLAQNPRFHPTATNDLLDCLSNIRGSWMGMTAFRAQGLETIQPRILSLLRGMVQGFYRYEFATDRVVFDKSRGHLANLELWEKILGHKVKVVCVVRDMRDIVASFERIFRESVLTDHPVSGLEPYLRTTVAGRCEALCHLTHTIGYSVATIRDALARSLSDRIVLVPYRELTHQPVECVRRICRECELEPFDVDPNNVAQLIHEDDTVYGMYTLHRVRGPRVLPARRDEWKNVLPDELADQIDKQFADIQGLAAWEE